MMMMKMTTSRLLFYQSTCKYFLFQILLVYTNSMQVLESSEDYLERILILSEKLEKVREIDIVNDMGFSKPSVSIAMKKLRDNGYILIENGALTLTPKGLAIAEKIYERHRILTKGFMLLGIDEETAAKDACKIEHDLSDITFEKIKERVEKHG